jgi:regulator of protease activity HflC (stomatin/prohibitin superfamily)
MQEKLRREQEAEQMKFVPQKEQQEAEPIVATGISLQLLEWKGIEATEKLAASPNSKTVVVGNTKSGLPLVFSGDK